MMSEEMMLLLHTPEGSALPLRGPELTIGRRSGSSLVLPGPEVSRDHARLIERDGGYLLEDLGAANGTFVNGRRIERVILRAGDEIRIGRTTLTVHALSADALPQGPAAAVFAEGDRLREEGRVPEAAQAYELGLRAEPGDHNRRLTLGRLLEAAGRWERAEGAYRAIPQGAEAHSEATSALKRLAEKWRVYGKVKTLLVEDGVATEVLLGSGERVSVEGPGWVVRFPLSADLSLLKTIAKTLALARHRLLETVGSLPESVAVEVYQTEEELRRESPVPTEAFATWMAGVYDGTVRVAVGEGALPEPPFLVLLLTHEVAHVAIEAASGGRCPAWLDEGIAQLVAQNLPRRAVESLKAAARREALLPLQALEGPLWRLEEKPLVDLAYAQSYSVAAFLEEAVGWQGLRALLNALGDGASTEEALKSLGWPYPKLEAAWQASLIAGGG